MNVNTVANILLIAAAVIWILARQVNAAPIKTRLLVLAPLLMGYFGIKDTPSTTWKSGADLAFILVGALVSIGLGLWRGGTIRVWRESDGVWWRAGSRSTLYLWGAMLAVRAVLAGVADSTGHRAADGLGPILFSLALSFAAQNAVIAMHMTGAVTPAPAQQPTYPASSGFPQQPAYRAPSDFQQQQPTYGAPSDFQQQADLRHERHEQRRADRRARRGQRWDR